MSDWQEIDRWGENLTKYSRERARLAELDARLEKHDRMGKHILAMAMAASEESSAAAQRRDAEGSDLYLTWIE